jgi:UDP-2,3-diacylglucosamine pyrophosphatase LpxH
MRLVISDTHVGDDRADKNLSSLFKTIETYASPDSHLILNGDIFDLASCLSMDSRHMEFMDVARKHNKITYIQGNHDWIIKGFGDILSRDIDFEIEFKETINDHKFRIIHGHQYDFVANWLPKINRFIIKTNHILKRFTNIDFQFLLRSTKIGKWMLSRQEKRILKKEKWADIIVAGHTHRPKVIEANGKKYINTGDWVERENRAYLLIDNDGKFELNILGK